MTSAHCFERLKSWAERTMQWCSLLLDLALNSPGLSASGDSSRSLLCTFLPQWSWMTCWARECSCGCFLSNAGAGEFNGSFSQLQPPGSTPALCSQDQTLSLTRATLKSSHLLHLAFHDWWRWLCAPRGQTCLTPVHRTAC